MTHAVISVHSVPAPTAPGIRSEASKRATSAEFCRSTTAFRYGSVIALVSTSLFGDGSMRLLETATEYSATRCNG